MNDCGNIKAGIVAAILAALCCAALPLTVAFGTVGLTAWLAKSAYVLIAVIVVGLGLLGVDVYGNRSHQG